MKQAWSMICRLDALVRSEASWARREDHVLRFSVERSPMELRAT